MSTLVDRDVTGAHGFAIAVSAGPAVGSIKADFAEGQSWYSLVTAFSAIPSFRLSPKVSVQVMASAYVGLQLKRQTGNKLWLPGIAVLPGITLAL